MLDTVTFRFDIELDQEHLLYWQRTVVHKANGAFYLYFKLDVTLENGASIRCTYNPHNYKGQPLLLIEFSLPKLVYGNNYTMLVDLEMGIDKANEVLSHIPGLPVLDLRDAIINRLDICYNHQVGGLVPYFIKALQFLEYSRRDTKPYTTEGVQYYNGQRSTKFYDKQKECGDPAAHGILRQETTLRADAVKKLTGKKKPTIRDITVDMLADVLESDLEELGLLNRSIGSRSTTLERLIGVYGEEAGVYYFGLLKAKMDIPAEALENTMTSHPRSLPRRLKKILDAGVPLTITESEEALPMLKIERQCEGYDVKDGALEEEGLCREMRGDASDARSEIASVSK